MRCFWEQTSVLAPSSSLVQGLNDSDIFARSVTEPRDEWKEDEVNGARASNSSLESLHHLERSCRMRMLLACLPGLASTRTCRPAWLMRVAGFSTIHVVLPSSLTKTTRCGSHSG
jgi:hypothetical protein